MHGRIWLYLFLFYNPVTQSDHRQLIVVQLSLQPSSVALDGEAPIPTRGPLPFDVVDYVKQTMHWRGAEGHMR